MRFYYAVLRPSKKYEFLRVSETIENRDEKHVVISCSYSLGGYTQKPVIRGKLTWTVYGSGDIFLDTQAEVREGLPFLPRFGLQLQMPKGNERVYA